MSRLIRIATAAELVLTGSFPPHASLAVEIKDVRERQRALAKRPAAVARGCVRRD